MSLELIFMFSLAVFLLALAANAREKQYLTAGQRFGLAGISHLDIQEESSLQRLHMIWQARTRSGLGAGIDLTVAVPRPDGPQSGNAAEDRLKQVARCVFEATNREVSAYGFKELQAKQEEISKAVTKSLAETLGTDTCVCPVTIKVDIFYPCYPDRK